VSGRLAGKRALITGGASGLGAAIAETFVAEGAAVFLTDIREDAVAGVARRLGSRSARHDVASESDWVAVVEAADDALGGFDVLVNNAGIGSFATVEDETLENWRKVMAVDVDSIFLGCKHALRVMKGHAPGSIVNISSIAGLLGQAELAAYNAAKAGAWLLTKSIALHCAKRNYEIRANSVHPAFIKTPILDGMRLALGAESDEELHAKLARGIPLKRIGEPADVAWACVYLASDESKFVTGAELKIDGGLSAW